LVGKLTNYPAITQAELFTVVIEECEASLNTDSAQDALTNQRYIWGATTATYDIGSSAIALISQTPACNYPLDVTFEYEDLINNPGTRLPLSGPLNGVSVSGNTFTISKCDPATDISGDSDCTDTPYEIRYKIWITSSLTGEPTGVFDNTLNFIIEIGDTCDNDEITLTNGIESFNYYL